MRPAPWPVRIGARVVDVVLLGWLVAVLVVEVQGRMLGGDPSATAVGVAFLAASGGSEVLPVAVWGRSLGKAVLGLRVVRAGDGGPPGVARSLLRWAVLFGAVAVPVAGWVVVLAVALTRLHDRLAGTVVVDAGREAGPRARGPG